MPSTPTVLDTVTSSGSGSGISSNSISPTGNALLIAVATPTSATAATRLPIAITDTFSPAITWVKQAEDERIGAADTATITIWTALLGATPGSGVVTATASASNNRRCLHILEVASDFNTTTPVKQSGSNDGATDPLIITLGATPDSDSLVIAAIAVRGSITITKDTDYTELIASQAGANHRAQIQYDAASADTTVQWSNLGTLLSAGVAIEIDKAVAATAKAPPLVIRPLRLWKM
jgi:hypothetical protein